MQGKDATFVRRFAGTLTRFERLVLALHYVDELSIHEVGAVLNAPTHEVEETLRILRERTAQAAAQWHAVPSV